MKASYIFGRHAVESLFKRFEGKILKVYSQLENDSLFVMAQKRRIATELVSKRELDRLTDRQNHQGILAVVTYPKVSDEKALEELVTQRGKDLFLLILDGITDPHNLGACLRTACALGVDGVILPRDRACGITSTVCKVASGAVGQIAIMQVSNLARTLRFLKEQRIWLYGTSEHSEKELSRVSFNFPLALVTGSEAKGMRRLTSELCDLVFKIPMYNEVVNSLNVSVATGIGLFAAVQRRIKN